MRSFAELEGFWTRKVAPPRDRGDVILIVSRPISGVREVLERAQITLAEGLVGDRWVRGKNGAPPDRRRQLTLMNVDVLRWLSGDDIPLHTAGDNFIVDFDLSEAALPVGARVRMGEVLLEVSELPHTGCKKFKHRYGEEALRWISDPAHRERRLRGINCTVLEPGDVSVGDGITRV